MAEAVFAVRQRMEKQGKQNGKFVDLENECDRVPRQEVWRPNREKGLSDNYLVIVSGYV